MVFTILKWLGGKARIAEFLLQRFPEQYGDYHEPFLGGGSIALALYNAGFPNKMYLSDVNEDLIEFYHYVKSDAESLILELKKIDDEYNPFENKLEKYLELRNEFNLRKKGLRHAAIFYFLNKTGYNGLMRYNSWGSFNAHFGNRPFVIDEAHILLFQRFMQSEQVEIFCSSYDKITPKPQDLVYLDPPYHPIRKTAGFREYAPGSKWNLKSEGKLREVFDNWNSLGCYLILSNNDVPEIRELFSDYTIENLQVAKAIGRVNSVIRNEMELVVRNYTYFHGEISRVFYIEREEEEVVDDLWCVCTTDSISGGKRF